MSNPFDLLNARNLANRAKESVQYEDCESCEYCANRIPPFQSKEMYSHDTCKVVIGVVQLNKVCKEFSRRSK
jgi:hypothetical protein